MTSAQAARMPRHPRTDRFTHATKNARPHKYDAMHIAPMDLAAKPHPLHDHRTQRAPAGGHSPLCRATPLTHPLLRQLLHPPHHHRLLPLRHAAAAGAPALVLAALGAQRLDACAGRGGLGLRVGRELVGADDVDHEARQVLHACGQGGWVSICRGDAKNTSSRQCQARQIHADARTPPAPTPPPQNPLTQPVPPYHQQPHSHPPTHPPTYLRIH